MAQKNHKYCLTTAILLALFSATAMSCDDDSSSNACISRCVDESTAIECVNGSEKTVPCESNEVCSDGQCMALTSDTCSTTGSECVTGDSFRSCVGGYWSSVAKCNDGKVCSKGHCVDGGDSCRLDARQCSADNSGYMICTDDDGIERWSGVIPCDNGTVCNGGECVSNADKCTATEPECTADNKGYRVCVQGIWSNVIPCTGTATCQNGQCTGEDVTSKLPCSEVDKMECISNTRVKVCGRDKYWSFMDCPADVPLCDMGKNECVAAKCNDSDVQCRDEKTLGTCVDHDWKYTECPNDKPLCKNNTCQEAVKECNPGQKKCISSKIASACTSDGYWETVNCTGEETCIEGMCAICKENDTRCGSDYHSLQTCKNGKWKTTNCPSDKPYCPVDGTSCKAINAGDACDDGFSLCEERENGGRESIIWICDSDNNKTKYISSADYSSSYTCVYALDGIGASFYHYDYPLKCSNIGETRINSLFYRTRVSCQICKKYTDSVNLWYVVDDSYCNQ